MAPMMGSTKKPGSTKSAPMEKPTERTRAGMASEREARTPGPTMASEKSMPALPMNATGTLGASANTTANPARHQ